MDSILPRKYNNKVVIGLAIGLAVAIGVALYFYMREPAPTLQHQPQPNPQHGGHVNAGLPVKPEHVETRVADVTGKPALVLIWAKWCGPSQQFKPVWDKVAAILNKDGSIEAGDIEHDENKDEIGKLLKSIPNFPGFPNVRFFPDGYGHDKRSIQYQGNRTEEDVLRFAYQAFKG